MSRRLFRVRAAGGVVTRQRDEQTEVLLVHRPRYDDWSLPKGKVDPGETLEQAALREVEEETGFRCALGPPVSKRPAYVDRKLRLKTVHYWRMTVVAGEFVPNREVDQIRWCTPQEAGELLTHTGDVAVVLDALAEHRA